MDCLKKLALSASVLAAALTGCMVDPGDAMPMMREPMTTSGPPRLGSMEVFADASTGADGGDLGEAGFELDPVPEVTHWSSIPLSGRGPAHGRALVETEQRGTVPAEISSLGTFCLDVPLVEMKENTFVVRVVDAEGAYSDSVEVKVRQEGSPPAPEPVTTEVKNVAAGAEILRMTTSADEGSPSAMTDGDPGTYVELWNSSWDDDWMIVELTERANVERIRFQTTEGCIMQEFKVRLTDSASPSDPVGNAEGWNLVEHVTSMKASQDLELTFEPQIARYMAVEFIESGCENWRYLQWHEIREIEVWTAEQVTVPTEPPQAPSCISGTERP
jgi:hypothetical protein